MSISTAPSTSLAAPTKPSPWPAILLRAGFLVSILALWEVGAQLSGLPPYLLPPPFGFGVGEGLFSPDSVATAFQRIGGDGTLLASLLSSLQRMAIGYGISVVCGITLGMLLARVWVLRQTLGSLVLALQSLPSICWLPFALVWVGINENAILVVLVLGALFSIAISTEGAIRNIPPIYLKVGRVLGARKLAMSRDILFFAALPELLGGLKVGWTFAWRSLMAAELIRADVPGIGAQLQTGRDFNDMALMFAAVLTILAVGLTVDILGFGTVERYVRRRYGLEK